MHLLPLSPGCAQLGTEPVYDFFTSMAAAVTPSYMQVLTIAADNAHRNSVAGSIEVAASSPALLCIAAPSSAYPT